MACRLAFESRQGTKPREGSLHARYGDLVCTRRAAQVLEDSRWGKLSRRDAAASGCCGLILRRWPADRIAQLQAIGGMGLDQHA
jgi:hypothetical protein